VLKIINRIKQTSTSHTDFELLQFAAHDNSGFYNAKLLPASIMSFGQLVIGPPGSGKTTYCDAMQQFMRAMKR
jgi:type II secretory ATPase GspE/PulE/Tfp pilus assembly ATPase PilB-like protein